MEKVFSLRGHLSAWLKKQRMGDSKAPTLWPSAAGALDKDGTFHGTCRRQAFLQYLLPLVNYSEKTDDRYKFWRDLVREVHEKVILPDKYQLWLFKNADLYESYIVEQAKESGIFVAGQVPIYIAKYNISGKIDLLSKNPETGKYIIDEVKSVYSYGADAVLGKNFERFYNFSGEPRTKNLMQVSLYQWHLANDTYDNARLSYGDRGTGKYAEYEVAVDKESGTIRYRCIDPVITDWKTAKYTIHDMLEFYKQIQIAADQGNMPGRDFAMKYSLDQLNNYVNQQYEIIELDKEDADVVTYKTVEDFVSGAEGKKGRKFRIEDKGAGAISKTTAEQYVKYKDRVANGGRQVKEPRDGDFECSYCPFRKFCYDDNGDPRV